MTKLALAFTTFVVAGLATLNVREKLDPKVISPM